MLENMNNSREHCGLTVTNVGINVFVCRRVWNGIVQFCPVWRAGPDASLGVSFGRGASGGALVGILN